MTAKLSAGDHAVRPAFGPAPCIWCEVPDYRPSREHILPESMGCPPGLVLDSDVCAKCNNDLAHLDRALLRPFEVLAFMGNVQRKGGRPPSIDSWASMLGRYTANGAEIHINAGPGVVTAMGRTLKPVQATGDLQDLAFAAAGGIGTLKFSQRIGDDPKFLRGLYKVAFEVAVFWLGPRLAGNDEIAFVRKFVRKGRGNFQALLLGSDGETDHHFTPPWRSEETGHLAVGMRIFGIDFVVDFDPQQRLIGRMKGALVEQGIKNWTALPLGAAAG